MPPDRIEKVEKTFYIETFGATKTLRIPATLEPSRSVRSVRTAFSIGALMSPSRLLAGFRLGLAALCAAEPPKAITVLAETGTMDLTRRAVHSGLAFEF